MNTFLLLIQTVSLAAVAAAFVMIAVTLGRFLSDAGRQGVLLRLSHEVYTTSQKPTHPAKGYAVYAWSGDRWNLEDDFSKPGCETTPPARAGAYEGQLVKKEAALR